MSVNKFSELYAHKGHKVEVVTYGNPPQNVAIECEDCNEVLLDFDAENQCCSCEQMFQGTVEGDCPNCHSGNWVNGHIDGNSFNGGSVDVTEDTVTIKDPVGKEIAHWIIDEVSEDTNVAFVIANALKIYYEKGIGSLIERLLLDTSWRETNEGRDNK